MTTTIDINGQKVDITLTPEQVAEIKRKSTDFKDLNTIEKCFEFLGEDYGQFLKDRAHLPAEEIADAEITRITKALNGGEWVQEGYWPYFNHNSSPGGFSYGDYGYDDTSSFVGSRRLYRDVERTRFAANTFTHIYQKSYS